MRSNDYLRESKNEDGGIAIRESFKTALSGNPNLSEVICSEELKEASYVMSRAFVFAKDPTWLHWLPTKVLKQLEQGDREDAVNRVACLITCMLTTFAGLGGTVLAYRDKSKSGKIPGRILGAVMVKFPGVEREGLLDYIKAVRSIVAAFNMSALIPSCLAYMHMVDATEAVARDGRLPLDESMYINLVGVEYEFWGNGIATSLFEPYLQVADKHGLAVYLENSNPNVNTPWFLKRGFQMLKEHVYAGKRLVGQNILERLGVHEGFTTPIMRRLPIIAEARD